MFNHASNPSSPYHQRIIRQHEEISKLKRELKEQNKEDNFYRDCYKFADLLEIIRQLGGEQAETDAVNNVLDGWDPYGDIKRYEEQHPAEQWAAKNKRTNKQNFLFSFFIFNIYSS